MDDWTQVLRAEAGSYARVALANIRREFPSGVYHTMKAPGDFPYRPRALTPAFYGSFDWHSSVEMHWLLVRLLRVATADVPADEIRVVLGAHFERVSASRGLRNDRPESRSTGPPGSARSRPAAIGRGAGIVPRARLAGSVRSRRAGYGPLRVRGAAVALFGWIRCPRGMDRHVRAVARASFARGGGLVARETGVLPSDRAMVQA